MVDEERPGAGPAEVAPALLTTHPSALLRLRNAEDREPAFEQLVADLAVARDAAGI